MPNNALDALDCAIVDLLQQRGDIANVELARTVGLSPAATLRRVARLRADGVISGVHARVDPERVGAGLQAFVLVVLDEHDEDSAKRFAQAVAQMPQVLRADAVSGADDVLLHVAAAGTAELQEVLRALPRIGARRATTMLRLGPVKEQSPTPLSPTPPSGAARR
ncbi:Lrp/AsnC family transcriptional regulator [Modestobacter italicus]|uniref:Lrp/AsnC family transcriptional regulator n=1 Tax=Modestobacter italicus (strain DSM 44449 / CECT 9708 / BC 501) TaxID=2732864 RepID=UPI001C981B6F|nr:Lrp/AsnC family transcriptional regulator [Modestobacter italicus]